jgi:hypothetical protein
MIKRHLLCNSDTYQVDHDVLVAEEEHRGAGVVQLVHGVEVRHLVNGI